MNPAVEKAQPEIRFWICDLCGNRYIVKPENRYVIYKGKKYCYRCQGYIETWKRHEQAMAEKAAKERIIWTGKTLRRIAAFDAERIRDGVYQPPAGGRHLLLSASIISTDIDYSKELTEWARVSGGKTELHVTRCVESEFSGYHDEQIDHYCTNAIQKPGWEDDTWYESEEWIKKTAVRGTVPDELALDALYYEGYATITKERWSRYASSIPVTVIVYLRRCEEGYRLLRICREGRWPPFEFDFKENSIRELYSEYAEKSDVFEDFLLSESECGYLGGKLWDTGDRTFLRGYDSHDHHVGLIRIKGNHQTEESELPNSGLNKLLHIRRLTDEDYWGL